MSYQHIFDFERELADFVGSSYAVTTDCCTHALELCLRLLKPPKISSSAFTYVSVPMLYLKLGIDFELTDEQWIGEYNLKDTPIWDSARLLKPNMHRKGQLQCVSFGNGKPIDNKRGGAILTDNEEWYHALKKMSYDGRVLPLSTSEQEHFTLGFHYNMPIEHAIRCSELLKEYKAGGSFEPTQVNYYDCRNINLFRN
jgi:dTDP-4-amino-4,6-dideoxygalactose transaminase